jgi:hypothetical protein
MRSAEQAALSNYTKKEGQSIMQKALFAAAISALAATSSVAFARNDISFSQDGRLAFAAAHTGTTTVHKYVPRPKSKTIFSNLASAYPMGLYFPLVGHSIYSVGSNSQFLAGGFTPTANATAVEVQVAVGELGDGHSSYTLSIYSDASGVPGTALASTVVTSKAPFGECCGMVTGKFTGGGVALTGGTPYWAAITLNAAQQKAQDDGAWMFATVDQVNSAPFAINENNSGWVSEPTQWPGAFGVFSK